MIKRTCNGCRALNETSRSCMLGKKIEVKSGSVIMRTTLYKFKPLEQCPKPTTNKEFNAEYFAYMDKFQKGDDA